MRGIRALAFASVSLVAFATPAMAQDTAPAEEGLGNSEIIVQARRRDESTQEVPAVVEPVTAEEIGKLNLRKFEDIASVVPGLSLAANANGIGVKATVRGVNYDVNVSGNNGTIQFYQNDVPVSAGLLFNALFDVGQIEVLRGPQGTLKGRSSPSGAITVFTRRPDLSEVGGKAEATINDIDGWNLNGALNVPVIADKLGVRIAGVVTEGQGNRVRDLVNTTKPSDKTQGIRASASADPFDGLLELDFTYQNVHRKAVQFGQNESFNQVVANAGASPTTIRARDRRSAIGLPATNDQKFTSYDWQAKLHLAGQQLTYVGGISKQHFLSFGPADAAGIFSTDEVNGVLFGQPTDTTSKNRSHEIRLQNEERIFGMFDYVIGYLDAFGTSDTIFKSVTGIALAPPFANPPRLVNIALTPINRFGDNWETSIFGSVTAHLGERTEVSGGVRRIKYKDSSGLAVDTGAGFVLNPALSRNFTEKKTVYQASIKHQFTDDVMVYASTGSSWRPSTVAIGGPTAGISPQQLAFLATPPETSKSYEAGIKSEFLDKTLRVNVTAFYQKFKNYPYRSSSGVYAIDRTDNVVRSFNYVAAVPVKVKGVEAEVNYAPSRQFSIGGNISYSKGTISNGTVPCLDLNNDGAPDVVTSAPTLPQMEADVGAANIDSCAVNFNATLSPRWAGTIQSEYNHPLSDNLDGYVRGLFSWKGRSDNDPSNAYDDVKSYGILNLYAGVRDPDGAWEVALFAKNITNTFRVLTRSNGPAATVLRGGIPLGGPVVSSGSLSTTNYFNEVTVTEPREFGINFKVAFGSR